MKKKPSAIVVTRPAVVVEPVAPAEESAIVLAPPAASDLALQKAPRSPVTLYLSTLAEGDSRRAMTNALKATVRVFAESIGYRGEPTIETFPWWKLQMEHVAWVRQQMRASGAAPATVNQRMSAIRGVLKASAQLKLMKFEDSLAAASVAKNVKGRRIAAGRALEESELDALLEICDTTPIGLRDAALIVLLYTCCMREAEAASLDLDSLTIRWVKGDSENAKRRMGLFIIRGKGDKEREMVVSGRSLERIEEWLDARGRMPGPLLYSFDARGKVRPGQRLTVKGIYHRIVLLAERAKLEHASPHDLRRTSATDMLGDGIDLRAVSEMMGHSQLQTTMIYDRSKRNAMVAGAVKFQNSKRFK